MKQVNLKTQIELDETRDDGFRLAPITLVLIKER